MLRQGQNEQALAVFREIYERTREPRALWRMATAEAALGRWVEAEGHMSSAFGSTSDAWIRAERAGLEATLRQVQARVGLLTVRCNVAGASIEVDGRAVTSFPLRVVAGDVRVRVRAEGYQEAEATVSVPGNVERAFVREVELRPVAGAQRVEVAGTVIGGGGSEARLLPVMPASGSGLRTGGIIALSAGAVGLATGVVGLVLRNSAVTRFNENQACGMSGGVVEGGTGCSDDVATTNTMQTVSLVGFIAGGALAATGVVLLIAAPARSGSERAASGMGRGIRIAAGPGQIGIGIGGNW
jgi:predicted outer membrane repeat protein